MPGYIRQKDSGEFSVALLLEAVRPPASNQSLRLSVHRIWNVGPRFVRSIQFQCDSDHANNPARYVLGFKIQYLLVNINFDFRIGVSLRCDPYPVGRRTLQGEGREDQEKN